MNAAAMRQEKPVLDDKVTDPVVRTTVRGPRSVFQKADAIAEATGNSQNDVLVLWLKMGNETWMKQATPEQRARFERALLEVQAKAKKDEEPAEPVKKPGKKGGKG